MADDDENENEPEEGSEDEQPEEPEEDDDDLADEDDDDSVLEGDDELDADEKAMLDEPLDEDDDDDLDEDDEELDEEKAQPVTEREQRRAGWGCLFLLVALPVAVWYGAKIWIAGALEIDQTAVPEWYLEAVRNDAIALQDPDASFVPPTVEVDWMSDFDAAQEKARETESAMVITFVTDNDASERMTNGTWLNRNVAFLLRDAVAVRLDLGDETTDLAERFQVTSAPTTLFVTPDLERLRPDTARMVDATDMEIYLYETLENHEERRLYREPSEDEGAPEEAPSEEAPGE